MAYDYPTEKISVYVSDDGGSQLTLFAFMEAAKFASHWLPFCRKTNIIDRSPEAYFASKHSWSSDAEKIKIMYERMKVRLVNVLELGKVCEEYITDESERKALSKWTDEFTHQDHSTIIKVLLESSKNKDITDHLMPNLIYLSREKSKTSSHHFKAGALNALLRVSAAMTNAPIILTLDCDTYSNDPQTPLRALCYLSDPKLQSKLGYVQFLQMFHGINKNDTYGSEYKRVFQTNPMGMDGLLGPNYVGTGCYFNRWVFFGGPLAFISPEITEISPYNVVNKPIQSQQILDLAHKVARCNYENNTKWGFELSEPWFFLYVFLFVGAYGSDFLEFIVEGGTVQRWWNDQRMWMIRVLSGFFFAFLEYFLKCLGISTYGFSLTNKVVDDEQSKRYDQGVFEFGVPSPMFVPITMAAIINLVSFFMGLMQVLKGSNSEGLFLQMSMAGFVVVNSMLIYEAVVLRRDKGRMPVKITTISTCLALALYVLASPVLFI
ncbi:cellulose synthase-like protein G3 isoform X2 [Quercus suber]|uniref:cellulose synthase-like protein G3 isoform X2 n=1 Tax=Quercus suber TaxID=58331 RepID=UPI0032E00B58